MLVTCRVSLQISAVLENGPSVSQIKTSLDLDNYSILGLCMQWKNIINVGIKIEMFNSTLPLCSGILLCTSGI